MFIRESRIVSFLATSLTLVIGTMAMLFALPAAQAQTFSVIYTFTGGADGAHPMAGVTIGGSGTLYGTAEQGGTSGNGVAFALKQRGSGWALGALHQFSGPSEDGARPQAPLAIGPNGALFGTTTAGGLANGGVVFELRPPTGACKTAVCYWDESVLQSFIPNNGDYPFFGPLVFDKNGNIYGTASLGGFYGGGVAYELVADNDWSLNTLYSFDTVSGSDDGFTPLAGMIFDAVGNLYGTTENGGPASGCSDGCGTVFSLNLIDGKYEETLVYPFSPASGFHPTSTPIMDGSGNLYGTTFDGGTVFELVPNFEGWQFFFLYSSPTCHPYAGVTMDTAGNLYGTCSSGGAEGVGMVYKLTNSGGSWTLTDLHDFTGGSDGATPTGAVVLDSSGNVYGTASVGGNLSDCSGGCGTIWTIAP